MKSFILFALGFCCCFSLGAQTVYYVKPGGSGAQSGASWSDAMANVQDAMDVASVGDQIWVAAGKFYGNSSTHFGIVLRGGVALYGGFTGTEININERTPGHVSQLEGDYVNGNNHSAAVSAIDITLPTILDGFTVAPSQSSGPKCRGIYLNNVSAALKISNCIIDGNTTSTSYDNAYGAGVYMENGSQPVITNCTISNNTAAGYGGGVYCLESSPTFIECRFANNSCSSLGGGAYNHGTSAIYAYCTFVNNVSNGLNTGRGGALSFSGGGDSKLINCLITNNLTNLGGAGVYCSEAGLSIINCTLTANLADNETGGAAIMYAETGASTLTINNSIIWNNESTHGDASLSLNEIMALNGSADLRGTNNLIKYGQYGSLGEDPQFVDPAAGNFQLLSTSPAIDAGNNSATGFVSGDTDLVGNHRIINQVIDLGVYEALTNKITNNGEATFQGFGGALDITANPYENDLKNTYKWKMIISSDALNGILMVNPADLAGYSGVMTALGIVFDSTHFQVGDLIQMPALLKFITGVDGWDKFNGDIIVSRVVYPNTGIADSIISNSITLTIASALPVSIMNFTGRVHNKMASLSWHTAAESAFDHFILEKSKDGKIFTIVATIMAKGDNSSYQQAVAQLAQKRYYRLRLVDQDGHSSYYKKVLTLTQNISNQGVQLYPNPATTTIYLYMDTACQFHLYDASGRLVKTGALKAGLNKIDIRGLSKGVYFGQIDGAGKFKVLKK